MADRANRVGQRIGDYHLLRKLGGGSFGDVYLGVHVRTQTQAAVKVLQTRLTRSNELKEFINEARTFRLRHPHIIPLLDFGIDSEDIPFLVMDYASNGTLRDKHPKGTQVPLSTILTYTTPLASALQYAHDQHLIHRDVKPENMLLNARHEVLLSDFGISTVAQSSRSINEPEGIGGTLPYMAPEQLKGKTCQASDQYALGIVVYEWLTGTRPFTGTVIEVAMQHYTMSPPPLREQVPTLSPDVEQVVLTALAKNPKERFASVMAFANALKQASQMQDGETSPHVEPPPPAITSTPPPASVPLIPTLSTVGLVEVLSPLETEQISDNVSPLPTNETIDAFSASVITPAASLPTTQPPVPVSPHREKRRVRLLAFVLIGLAILIIIGSLVRATVITQIAINNAHATATAMVLSTIVPNNEHATATAQTIAGATATMRALSTVPATAYNTAVATNGIMFGFDAQHTGFNPYENTLNTTNVSGLTLAWTSEAIGKNSFSSTVVSGNLAYVATLAGRLYAIDITTGHIRWASNPEGTSSLNNVSTPAVINGIVYICLQDHRLYAFDALSGNILWVSPSSYYVNSSPIVANSVVYVTGNGGVYAFDATSGRLHWHSPSIGNYSSPVAIANKVVYVNASGNGPSTGRIYALDAASGHSLWTSDLVSGGTDTNSAPTVANGLVYIGAGGGIAAFDATTGHVRWVTSATKGITTGSSPEVANGVVYITEDKVYAFNATTGVSLWVSDSIGAYNDDSPEVANGVLYVSSTGTNCVYALSTSNGQTLWISSPTNGQIFTTPAVADGVVYVASGDQDGRLYAFHLPG